jgi:hypothetical protein
MSEPKVTINKDAKPAAETPSQQLVAKANASVVIPDPRGRLIELKKPGVLAQFRLIEILGETAKNQVYTQMVLPLLYISNIDGDPVYQPASKAELEALIQRLDEDGVAAVHLGVQENFFTAADPDTTKAQVKN